MIGGGLVVGVGSSPEARGGAGKRDGPLAHSPLMRHFLGNLMATK